MKNKIEKLVKSKSKASFNKRIRALQKEIGENPVAQKKILKEFRQSLDERGKTIERLKADVDIKMKMKEVSEIVSLSYVAEKYFNKTRQWLYQRINGNVVNGKASKFTDEELNKLQFALKDISKKIGSLSI